MCDKLFLRVGLVCAALSCYYVSRAWHCVRHMVNCPYYHLPLLPHSWRASSSCIINHYWYRLYRLKTQLNYQWGFQDSTVCKKRIFLDFPFLHHAMSILIIRYACMNIGYILGVYQFIYMALFSLCYAASLFDLSAAMHGSVSHGMSYSTGISRESTLCNWCPHVWRGTLRMERTEFQKFNLRSIYLRPVGNMKHVERN